MCIRDSHSTNPQVRGKDAQAEPIIGRQVSAQEENLQEARLQNQVTSAPKCVEVLELAAVVAGSDVPQVCRTVLDMEG